MNFISVGQMLKNRRLTLGLSQKELADKANCRLNSVSELEVGKDLSVDIFVKVCDVLQVCPDYIFSSCDKKFTLNAIAVYCINNKNNESNKTIHEVMSLLGEE